ncbi:hypothetical protein SAMN05421803_14318 [Nocardiopsis flavescens]|uniref:Uncharacterized protein n=1 Tax=Nocardiopsis flavescens TaxID=758803 RepID=A0A1M6WFL3_9ACTN|nr:hypothetical protein [Nocardiopsis flavescens]SHK92562.1 hypothetical protein SAMN05421803_14318 [Nocardiopsis flavescens]
MTHSPIPLAGLALMLLALGVLSFEVGVLATLAAGLVLADDAETEDLVEDAGVDRCC